MLTVDTGPLVAIANAPVRLTFPMSGTMCRLINWSSINRPTWAHCPAMIAGDPIA